MKRSLLHGAAPWVVAAAFGFATAAHAQTVDRPQPQAEPSEAAEVEEVVVTGSLIRGTPEDAALPVDVIGADELERQGSPSIVELIKALPVSNGVLGDTNQFDTRAQGSEGSGSVNLRGLGPERTLVLLNGRRIPINPFGLGGAGVVDTNMIPVAAVGRIEVLKDGAAATYGSDAIGGVVNFITRENFDGLEVGGDYQFIDGSDGDYSVSAIFGKNFDNANVFFAFGHQHRSELQALDRDWAIQPFENNPEGGWSGGGSPGTFVSGATVIPPSAPGGRATISPSLSRDPLCAALGGYPGFASALPAGPPGATAPRCYGQFTQFDNLVEREDRYQLFSSIDVELSGDHNFRAEVNYGYTEVPEWKTSPSYLPLGSPSCGIPASVAPAPANCAVGNGNANPVFDPLNGNYFVPAYAPTLQDFVAKNPQFAFLGVAGATFPVGTFRPFLLGGNPLFGNGPSQGERSYDQFRISAGFDGTLADFGAPQLNYDLRVTYGQQSGYRSGYDSMTNRLALAMRGFGGPDCDKEPNTPGVQVSPGVTVTSANAAALAGTNGCAYFNPFSTAIQQNVITGQTNPQYNSNLQNTRELTEWFFVKGDTEQTSRLFVLDALISGETGLKLPGGDVQFALGAQYRRNYFEAQYSNINDADVNPCVGTPDYFVTNCSGAARNGPLVFLGVGTDADVENDVYAAFGELQIPVTEDFNIQLAARYEDYGGLTGSTFDPKISARWQITDAIALRGSAGTTFRGPPLVQLRPSNVTALSFIAGSFRAYDIGGNPNLEPESAETYSAGVILDLGGFKGSLDYYQFKFDNPIIAEPIGGIANTFFPGGASVNCNNPAFAALRSRFTFNGDCAAVNIGRVQTFYINGPAVETSGIDVLGEYDFGDVFGGEFSVGATFTYVLEYTVDPLTVEGIVVQPGFEAVGFLNYQTTAYPIPEIKGSAYAEYEFGDHNLRLTMNYIDEYTDQRTTPYLPGFWRDAAGNPINIPQGKTIDRFVTFDLSYRTFLPYDITLTATIDNLTDEDPSFARLDLNYDPFTGDALGRRYKIGLRKAF